MEGNSLSETFDPFANFNKKLIDPFANVTANMGKKVWLYRKDKIVEPGFILAVDEFHIGDTVYYGKDWSHYRIFSFSPYRELEDAVQIIKYDPTYQQYEIKMVHLSSVCWFGLSKYRFATIKDNQKGIINSNSATVYHFPSKTQGCELLSIRIHPAGCEYDEVLISHPTANYKTWVKANEVVSEMENSCYKCGTSLVPGETDTCEACVTVICPFCQSCYCTYQLERHEAFDLENADVDGMYKYILPKTKRSE